MVPEACSAFLAAAADYVPAEQGVTWEEWIRQRAEDSNGLRIEGTTAIQPVRGVIMQGASPEHEVYLGCFCLDRIGAAVDYVESTPGITALVLALDSPGGYTRGMSHAIQRLDSLAATRPDVRTASWADNAHSAAYWLAAATGSIHAAPGAGLGSIGTYAVTTDYSRAAANSGIEVRLHTDGKYKGMGTPGVAWSEDWLAYIDARVSALSAEFKGYVTARRPGLDPASMEGQPFDSPYPAGLVDSTAHRSLASLLAAGI